jgi:cytoskeletal protein RodZ
MDFKDLFTSKNIIIIIIIIILIIAIYFYVRNKKSFEKLTNPDDLSSSEIPTSGNGTAPFKTQQTTNLDKPDPSSTLVNKNTTNPNDLLPNSMGSNWGNLYPVQNDGGVNVPSTIDPSFSIGINTISSTLRNSNLDIRSEFAIPKVQVSPWNNSSIPQNLQKIGLDPTPSTSV